MECVTLLVLGNEQTAQRKSEYGISFLLLRGAPKEFQLESLSLFTYYPVRSKRLKDDIIK